MNYFLMWAMTLEAFLGFCLILAQSFRGESSLRKNPFRLDKGSASEDGFFGADFALAVAYNAGIDGISGKKPIAISHP